MASADRYLRHRGIVWLAFSGLGVAIPEIADEFDSDFPMLQWVNNAFPGNVRGM